MTEAELKDIEDSFRFPVGMTKRQYEQIQALIAEVRRLKEIESMLPDLELEHKFMREINERLELENERLEKALEFYVRKEQEGIA